MADLEWNETHFEGNIDREADDKENSEQDVNRSNDSSSTMSENPVSFVVGEPDNDRSEELEIEDSFPSESYDITTTQVQQNAMAGLIERRKRLRWSFFPTLFFFSSLDLVFLFKRSDKSEQVNDIIENTKHGSRERSLSLTRPFCIRFKDSPRIHMDPIDVRWISDRG